MVVAAQSGMKNVLVQNDSEVDLLADREPFLTGPEIELELDSPEYAPVGAAMVTHGTVVIEVGTRPRRRMPRAVSDFVRSPGGRLISAAAAGLALGIASTLVHRSRDRR